jgi:hypothetical protein
VTKLHTCLPVLSDQLQWPLYNTGAAAHADRRCACCSFPHSCTSPHFFSLLYLRIPWDLDGALGQDNGLGGVPGDKYCVLACEQWNSPLYCDAQHTQVGHHPCYIGFEWCSNPPSCTKLRLYKKKDGASGTPWHQTHRFVSARGCHGQYLHVASMNSTIPCCLHNSPCTVMPSIPRYLP